MKELTGTQQRGDQIETIVHSAEDINIPKIGREKKQKVFDFFHKDGVSKVLPYKWRAVCVLDA